MSRFDLILLFIFILIVVLCGVNVWLVVNGFEQLSPSFWGFATAVCAGEVVTFSLYRIAKGRKVPSAIKGRHTVINDLEAEDEETGK